MADVKTVDEGGELLDKRKLDLPKSINKTPEDDSSKRQKIEVAAGQHGSISLAAVEDPDKSEDCVNTVDAADDDDEDEEDYNAEEDGDGEAEIVDRKGKGIMVDRKGKGKMIEDSEDDDSEGHGDDDDDSSDDSDSDFSDGLDGSDLEDDPLAEVDLDNILPSRTRRSRAQPGVRISSDHDKGIQLLDELGRSSGLKFFCKMMFVSFFFSTLTGILEAISYRLRTFFQKRSNGDIWRIRILVAFSVWRLRLQGFVVTGNLTKENFIFYLEDP